MDDNDSFAKAVVGLVKRFTPQKGEVFISPDSLSELKQVVKAAVLASPKTFMAASAAPQSSFASNGNGTTFCGEDEDSRMSGCESSDSHSVSHYSNDDETSRTSTSGPALRKVKTASSSSISDQKNGKKCSRAKRMQELRLSRRKAMKTDEAHEFECSEVEFPAVFLRWYNQKIADRQQTACTLYQIFVNSLRGFYATITWERNIDNLVLHFLREHLVKSANQLSGGDEQKVELDQVLLEAQVQTLLELHAMSMTDSGGAEHNVDEVIKKLRLIYISSDSLKMKVFLDEQVADCFSHILPKELVTIFEELCVTLPADLEEHANASASPRKGNEKEEQSWFPTRNRRNSEQAKQLEKLLEETALTEVKENGHGQRKKLETRLARNHSQVLRDGEASPSRSTRSRLEARREIRVPDTPEEKLLKMKKEPEDEEGGPSEVVKQTPMAKLRGSTKQNSRSSRRLSELVRISEERIRPARAAAVASEKATKALMNTTVAPFCNKQVLLGLNSPTNRPLRSARSNLLDRFSYVSASSSSASPSSSEAPQKRSREKMKEPSTPKDGVERKRAKISQDFEEPEQDFGIAGFGVKQLEAYKLRMSELAKSTITTHVPPAPGGLRTDRRSLFDDAAESSKLHVEEGEVQKNRTGRAVRSQTTSVHLAHILLNVHNSSPLEAFSSNKVGAGTPVKLQRLVRTAKKRDVIRLKKLVSRVKMTTEASPSTSQASTDSTPS